MDTLIDHGYVPSNRELRFSFKPPRPLDHPDLSFATLPQTRLAAYQYLMLAKSLESAANGCRAFGFLEFSPHSSVDLLVVNAQHKCLLFSIKDWECMGLVESPIYSLLSRLEETSRALQHVVEQKEGVMEPNCLHMDSYLLLPCLTNPANDLPLLEDQRVIRGRLACDQLLTRVFAPTTVSIPPSPTALFSCLNKVPQFDVLVLRAGGHPSAMLLFGTVSRFINHHTPDSARSLTRLTAAQRPAVIQFEHAKSGLVSVPLALFSGVLGWEPTTRVVRQGMHYSVDVSPTLTQLEFHIFDGTRDGTMVTLLVNDVERLELVTVVRSVEYEEETTTMTTIAQFDNELDDQEWKADLLNL